MRFAQSLDFGSFDRPPGCYDGGVTDAETSPSAGDPADPPSPPPSPPSSSPPSSPPSSTDGDPEGGPRRILVVGGGFCGVGVARRLARKLPEGWEVVLYSEENHFVFTPLLPEVVGATINPLHCVWPLREMVRGASCRTAPVVGLDLDAGEVIFEERSGELSRARYDHLVLCPGMAANLDVIPGLATHGWPLKGMGDALRLRNRLIGQLERAEVEDDPEERRKLLSVAVVGGGYTGVEVAGSMADLMKEATRVYERVDASEVRMTVVEMEDRILPTLPESLATFAERKMEERGITVRTGAVTEAVSADGLRLEDGEEIPADTVVAAVGNKPWELVTGCGLPTEGGRLVVGPEMRVEGRDKVWALGDCAAVPNAREDGEISPPTAQYATRQGRRLADNLLAVIRGGEPEPFDYRPQGMFALIGHRNAVGEVMGWKLSGFPAFFLWHGIYWAKMPSWTRKLQIGLDWAVNYLFRPDIVEIATLATRRQGRVREEDFLRLVGRVPELRDLPVSQFMSQPVLTLEADCTLAEAIRRCRGERIHALPVMGEEGKMVGICTRSDLYRAVRGLEDLDTPVSELMSSPVITLRRDTSVEEAVRVARAQGVQRLVVVTEESPDEPLGIVTPFDVLGWIARGAEPAPVPSGFGSAG